ncbi:MAG TPA: ABC transporter ATP-binding protein [Pirellulaceae bacterium]|nr:ABC transporter ATP-binding protein [Pirellulaceae bacterium]
METTTAIEAVDLDKTYRQGWLGRRSIHALRGVSLSVARGEIFGLLGPNGAGKTTFLKILLGIIRRTRGQATLLGEPVGSRHSRVKIGYLPEHLRIPPHHNAYTALDLYGQLSRLPRSVIRAKRGPLLESVGLAERARDSVKRYSKGMLQRLGLAQALLHDPEVIFLDEPTDGLDPVGRSHVRNVLNELKRQGKTIFLNSHILQEVELVCDRVAILDHGTVRYLGPVDAVVDQPTAEFQLELVGSEAAIRTALHSMTVDACTWTPELCKVTVRMPNPFDLDFAIDQLRTAQVSVLGIARRRISLEDAFLKLVGDSPKVL